MGLGPYWQPSVAYSAYVVYCVNCLVNKLLLLQGNSGEAVMVLLTHLLDHVIFTIVTVCLSVADASF